MSGSFAQTSARSKKKVISYAFPIFSEKWIRIPLAIEIQSLNSFLLRYSTMFVDNATAMLVAAEIKYSQRLTVFVKLEIHHLRGSLCTTFAFCFGLFGNSTHHTFVKYQSVTKYMAKQSYLFHHCVKDFIPQNN